MALDDAVRVQIRALYFVERLSVAAIAEHLALHPHAVRSALIVIGGATAPRDPVPSAIAATGVPTPPRREPAFDRRRARIARVVGAARHR
jgi:hypothetical protein